MKSLLKDINQITTPLNFRFRLHHVIFRLHNLRQKTLMFHHDFKSVIIPFNRTYSSLMESIDRNQ